MRTAKQPLRLVVKTDFDFNPEAQAAWQRCEDALRDLDSVIGGEISCQSVGAPGSAEDMLAAVALIESATKILRRVPARPEEAIRYKSWEAIYDV